MNDITWYLEKRKLSNLKEWENNPRILTEKGIEDLTNSIKKFGCCEPIVINTDGIICGGHGRKKVLEKLKVKEVDCYVPRETLSQEQFEELNLRLNKNIAGEFNFELLANNFDIDLLHDVGFTDEELGIDINEAEIIEDEAPNVDEVKSIAKEGDIWQLGKHRVICGDCTDVFNIEKLMENKKADMVFTDPPYGIDYSGGRTQVIKNRDYGKIENDNLSGQELGNLICNLFNVGAKEFYICVSPIIQKPFLDFIENNDKKINAVIVWDKGSIGLGYMKYRRQCEFILYITDRQFKKGDHSDNDLWQITKDNAQDYQHGNQKPVALSARAIKNSSQESNIIVDFFLGSGSTLIACEQTNRICYGCEIEPRYIDVILKRYVNYMIKNNQEKDIDLKCNGISFDYKQLL